MRRMLLTFTAGAALLTATACGTAAGPTPGGTGQAAPLSSAQQDARDVCEALGQVYSTKIGPFAQALSQTAAGRATPDGAKAAQQQAQQALGTFAKAIRTATQTSTNAEVRSDGAKTAKQLQAKAADDKFFGNIRTSKDVETLLGPTLKQWLAPVAKHCN